MAEKPIAPRGFALRWIHYITINYNNQHILYNFTFLRHIIPPKRTNGRPFGRPFCVSGG
jgi:hypothetical protein